MERARRRKGGGSNLSSSPPVDSSPHPTSSPHESTSTDLNNIDPNLHDDDQTSSSHSTRSSASKSTTKSLDLQAPEHLNGHVTPSRRSTTHTSTSPSPKSQTARSQLDSLSPDSKMAPITRPSSPARTRGATKRAQSIDPAAAVPAPILPPQQPAQKAATTRKSKRKLTEPPIEEETSEVPTSTLTANDGAVSRGSKRQKLAITQDEKSEPAPTTTSPQKRSARPKTIQTTTYTDPILPPTSSSRRNQSASSVATATRSSSSGPSRASNRNKEKSVPKSTTTSDRVATGRISKASTTSVRKSSRRAMTNSSEAALTRNEVDEDLAEGSVVDDNVEDDDAVSQQLQSEHVEATSVVASVAEGDELEDAIDGAVDGAAEVVEAEDDAPDSQVTSTSENGTSQELNGLEEAEDDMDGSVNPEDVATLDGDETELEDQGQSQVTDDEEDLNVPAADNDDASADPADEAGEQTAGAIGQTDGGIADAMHQELEQEEEGVLELAPVKPQKAKRGRPGKGMRGAKNGTIARPGPPVRAASKLGPKGKATAKGHRPGWQGKRKLASNWELQAYYDRQATLKQNYKGLMKIISQSTTALVEKNLARVKEKEPLHYKNEPEYKEVSNKLQDHFDARSKVIDAKIKLETELRQGLLQKNIDYQNHVVNCAIEDARDEAVFNAQNAILDLVKGHYQRVENEGGSSIVADNERSNFKVLNSPRPFREGHLDLDEVEQLMNEKFPRSFQRTLDPSKVVDMTRSKSSNWSPRKAVQQQAANRAEASAMAGPVIILDDEYDDDVPASTRQKSSIMGDQSGPVNDVTAMAAALGASLRSQTSTPALLNAEDGGETPADSAPSTPQPGTPRGGSSLIPPKEPTIPHHSEIWFPKAPKRGQAVPHNRLVGLPWFEFEAGEIGLRSMAHEGKGPPPEKGAEKQYHKEVRKHPNTKTVHFDRGSGHRNIESYQLGEINPDLAEEYGCHPKWGIPLKYAKNPEYVTADANGNPTNDRWGATDFSKEIEVPNPVLIKYFNSDEVFETSRSAKYKITESRFNALLANIRMTKALGDAGLLDRSATEVTTLDAMACYMRISKEAVQTLLDAVNINESFPDQAREIASKARKLQEKESQSKHQELYEASPEPVPKSERVSGQNSLEPVSPARVGKRPADHFEERRSKRRRTGESASSSKDNAHLDISRKNGGEIMEPLMTYEAPPQMSSLAPQAAPYALEALADAAELARPPPVVLAPTPPRRNSNQSFIQYAPPQMQQQQQIQQQQRQIYPAPMAPMPPPYSPYPPPPPQQHYRMSSIGQMGPPPPPSPAQHPAHHPTQQQPQHQHTPQAPRGIVPGSGLRNIRPRPDSHFYQNAATLPQYNPTQHQGHLQGSHAPNPPPPQHMQQPQYMQPPQQYQGYVGYPQPHMQHHAGAYPGQQHPPQHPGQQYPPQHPGHYDPGQLHQGPPHQAPPHLAQQQSPLQGQQHSGPSPGYGHGGRGQ